MSPALEAVLERVGEDSELTPEEKETTVSFSKRESLANVFTAEAGLSRRLLSHPHAEIQGVTLESGSARPEVPLEALEEHSGDIVAVRATLPIGALQIKGSPRADTGHAEVVTDRVFSDGSLAAKKGEKA